MLYKNSCQISLLTIFSVSLVGVILPLVLLTSVGVIKKENPKANIVVSPSDHIVTNPEEFRRVVTNCLKFTAETDAIVTLGMKPHVQKQDMATYRLICLQPLPETKKSSV